MGTIGGVVRLALAVALLTSCGSCSRSEPTAEELMRSISERTGVTEAQAACAAARLQRDLSLDERWTLVRTGLSGMRTESWTRYLQAMVACVAAER